MGLWLGIAAGFAAGCWLGAHPDPKATARQRWQSRMIAGCVGMIAGAAFSRLLVPAEMPPWNESIRVVDSAAAFEAALSEAAPGEPLLVDFFATWCGPCRGMAPNVNAAAESGIDVAVVDVDLVPEVAMRYGIELLPTVIVFRDGVPVRAESGYHSTDELRALAAGG